MRILTIFIFLLLVGAGFSVPASSGLSVSSVKCQSGWVKVGNNKLEVLKSCGKAEFSEQVSGENQDKQEGLFYQINNKNYIFYLEKGEVMQIELQYR